MEVDRVESEQKKIENIDVNDDEKTKEFNLFVTRQMKHNHTKRINDFKFCPYFGNIFATSGHNQINVFDSTLKGNFIGTVSNHKSTDKDRIFTGMCWIRRDYIQDDVWFVVGTNEGNIHCGSIAHSKIMNIIKVFNSDIKYIERHPIYYRSIVNCIDSKGNSRMINVVNGCTVFDAGRQFLYTKYCENKDGFIGLTTKGELMVYKAKNNDKLKGKYMTNNDMIKELKYQCINTTKLKRKIGCIQIEWKNEDRIYVNDGRGSIFEIDINNGNIMGEIHINDDTYFDINKEKTYLVFINSMNNPKIYNIKNNKIMTSNECEIETTKRKLKWIKFVFNEEKHLIGMDKDGLILKWDTMNHVKLFKSNAWYFENPKRFDCQTAPQQPYYGR